MIAIERGCGVREPGGVYMEVLLSKKGRPIEEFLFDPPLPLGGIEVPNRGVAILERPDGSGIHDVYDRVGVDNYPNVADMVEEIRRFGLSRRIPMGTDFSQLDPRSLIFLCHNRAILKNAEALYAEIFAESQQTGANVFTCPQGKREHMMLVSGMETLPPLPQVTCAGCWWETVTKGDFSFDLNEAPRTVRRANGSTRYRARQAPHEFKPEWEAGIFARFPLHRLAIVRDPEGGRDAVAHDRVAGCALPVVDVDY